jgi:D-alanyl-D-alanine carboxypeptidase
MKLCGGNSGVVRFLRFGAGACLAASIFATAAPAEARGAWRPYHHHGRHFAAHRAVYVARRAAAPADSAFSAIVVDANTGHELYGVNENAPRHPASITKVMTLYLLFEQLDKGALTLQSRIPISDRAAAQEPSKLGIAAGDSLSVDEAIKAIVTRSANDVAVAIAEAIGHDESSFAELMTRKAHALGMSRTIYRNASGLPNDEQITSAHDLTILARATEERFPKYFRYFATHEFNYDGEIIGNHNHLLGRVDGVDGIKTGYTRASGFNLLTSVHRDGRSLVAVVMGGRTAGARDRMMEQLIAQHIAEASNQGHTATMIADSEAPEAVMEPSRPPSGRAPMLVAMKAPEPSAHAEAAEVGEGDNASEEDDAPALRNAAALQSAPLSAPSPAPLPAPRAQGVVDASPESHGWVKGPDPAPVSAATPAAVPLHATRPRYDARRSEARVQETRVAKSDDAHRQAGGGWIVQIGASANADKANALLTRAREHNRATLATAKAVTEKVQKGEEVFYRARFADLDSATAEQACRSLKRSGFSCFAAHD